MIDRALSKILISRGKLQLLGVACLNLAAKYTEDRGKSPIVEDLAEITDNAYKPRQILEVTSYTVLLTTQRVPHNMHVQMEKDVLHCLDFELSVPTVHAFLTRFLRCGPSNQQEGALAQACIPSFANEP